MAPIAYPSALPDRPVFILGERGPASTLLRALGATPDFCALPVNRLLYDLLLAVERSYPDLVDLHPVWASCPPPARWYREVQQARAEREGKPRTVEFSGLAVARLLHLFPEAQFVVVHVLRRPVPRSRRIPALPPGRVLEVDTDQVGSGATLLRVLDFLEDSPAEVVVDVTDAARSQSDAPDRARR